MSAKADIKQKIAKVLVVIPVILVIIIVIATLITIRGIDKDEGILYDVYYHAQFVSLFGMGLAPYPCILMSSVAISCETSSICCQALFLSEPLIS